MEDEAEKLLAEIFHDLNTPLAAIRSCTDTMDAALRKLEDGAGNPETLAILRDSLRTSRLACERMILLVKRVRSSTSVDITHCIDTTLALMAHDLKPRITVTRNYGEIPTIHGDPNALSQVFMNLLVNAAHAIEGNGEIRIRTWQESGNVHVAISDTGPGIPPEIQQRIFDRGFTTKTEKEGAGLGLAICRKIVENHKGRIELQSDMGRGATFTIVLPERKTA